MARLNSKTDRAVEYAMSEARAAKDIAALPDAVRTVALVHTAQGVIDNGGLQYFFEADFPGNPPYALFIEAYRNIGAADAASALAQAVSLFPFAEPHLHAAKRNKFMDRFKDQDGEPVNRPFEPLTKLLCGNKSVWRLLEAHVEKNAKSLGV